jgi:hypothetical protein
MVHFVEKPISLNSRVVNDKTDGALTVACTTLDIALPEFGMNQVDILKIDTEGSERAVLAGAKAILPRVQRIVLELHHGPDEEKHKIDEMLRTAGLRRVAEQRSLVYYARL